MKDAVEVDRVETPGSKSGQILRAAHRNLQVRPFDALGDLEAQGQRIDRLNGTVASDDGGDVRGQAPCAASDVEHPLAGSDCQVLDQQFAVTELPIAQAVVGRSERGS